MITEDDIEQVKRQLDHHDNAQIDLYGIEVKIYALEDASKVFFMTSVYQGSSYIPSSIRNCMGNNKDIPFDRSDLFTFLTIDEKHYTVILNYLVNYEEILFVHLKNILEEFAHQATEWRFYLDEKDRHDRVHIRITR